MFFVIFKDENFVMQLQIKHKVDVPLELPINYHYIIQSIIFYALKQKTEYSEFLHDKGYADNKRTFKLFTFSLLKGPYQIRGKKIIFTDEVRFEIRSIEPCMLKILKDVFEKNGITYLGQHYGNVQVYLENKEVDESEITVKMCSPVCVYSTGQESGKTYYYHPESEEFPRQINDNFKRKYEAYTGVAVKSDVVIEVKELHPKDKYVTKYKGIYINGWLGTYVLKGERKYLNFLYQTGLGSKNSQGFGMFDIV